MGNKSANGEKRLRIAVNSRLWSSDQSSDYFPIFKKALSFGFDGVEIPFTAFSPNPAKIRRDLEQARRSADESRVFEVIIIGGATPQADISSADRAVHYKGVKMVEDCVKLCANMGGSLVCGPLYTPVGKKEHLSMRDRRVVLQRVAGSFKEISEYAKECGVRIALEPLCRYDTSLINTVSQGRRLLDLISRDNVGLLLDTFHLNIEEKSMNTAICAAGKKLFHFHACENDRGTPGTGLIDWNEVWSSLKRIDYKGLVSIESFDPSDKRLATKMNVWRKLAPSQDSLAREGLRFLKSLSSKIGI